MREKSPHFEKEMLKFVSRTHAVEPEDLEEFVETPWGWYQTMALLRRTSLPSIKRIEEFWAKQEMANKES
jgi:hypothetical protein